MFSSIDFKVKPVYIGVGGMIAIIGMLFAVGMLSSVMAQNYNFDTIQCSRLDIVDADGNVGMVLGINDHGGRVYERDGKRMHRSKLMTMTGWSTRLMNSTIQKTGGKRGHF